MASWAANACYSGYSFRLYRGNGGGLIRAFYRFNERYSLFRLAGETIWHLEGYSHDDDLRSNQDGYS